MLVRFGGCGQLSVTGGLRKFGFSSNDVYSLVAEELWLGGGNLGVPGIQSWVGVSACMVIA